VSNGWMVRVTKPMGDGPPLIQIYAVAESELAAAVGAVEQRTGVPRDQIEALSSLKSVAVAALGLNPSDVTVLSGTSAAEPTR
jgi:hypothetical protein